MTYDVVVDGKTHQLELTQGEKTWHCKIDGQQIEVDAALTARDVLSILVGGKAYEIKRERSLQGELHMVIGSARYAVDVQDPRSLRTRRAVAGSEAGPQKLKAPMPGKIVRIIVQEKDEVKAGQSIRRDGSHEDAERDEVSQGRPRAEDPHRGRLDRQRRRHAGHHRVGEIGYKLSRLT